MNYPTFKFSVVSGKGTVASAMCSFCVANHSNQPRHCDGLAAFGGRTPHLEPQQGLKSALGLAQRLIASPSEENVQVRIGRTWELQDHDKKDHDTPDEAPETPPDEPQPTPVDEPPAEPQVPYVVGGRGGRPS
jgi:hypothetical protein